MMTPMEIGGEPRERRSQIRTGIIVIGALLVATFLGRSARSDNYATTPVGEDPFENVSKDEEEDFQTTSKRSAINTVKLPFVPNFNVPSSTANVTKPKLYLHVGPVRTGVAKLKEQLIAMKDDLLLHNIVIADQIDTQALQTECQLELNSARETFELRKSSWLKKQKDLIGVLESEIPCWKAFLKSLERHNKAGTSVILSNELLSQQLLDVHEIGTAVMDWISLRETLMKNWDIVVVASYRRYFDWMPAAKADDEMIHIKQRTAELPRLARWPNSKEKGMLLEPLFPHFAHDALSKLDVPYTTRIVDLFKPFVSDVKVLDLYKDGQSIKSTFLCDIIESASACALSKQGSQTETLGDFLDVKQEIDWYNFQLFDELVTTASSHNIIRNRYISRITATKTTEYYILDHKNIHPRHDLPLNCPDRRTLNPFSGYSADFEKTLFGSVNPQHKIEFDKQVEENMFCSMNMRKILRQREWRTFFRHLTEKSAKRIREGSKEEHSFGFNIYRYLRRRW